MRFLIQFWWSLDEILFWATCRSIPRIATETPPNNSGRHAFHHQLPISIIKSPTATAIAHAIAQQRATNEPSLANILSIISTLKHQWQQLAGHQQAASNHQSKGPSNLKSNTNPIANLNFNQTSNANAIANLMPMKRQCKR